MELIDQLHSQTPAGKKSAEQDTRSDHARCVPLKYLSLYRFLESFDTVDLASSMKQGVISQTEAHKKHCRIDQATNCQALSLKHTHATTPFRPTRCGEVLERFDLAPFETDSFAARNSILNAGAQACSLSRSGGSAANENVRNLVFSD